ncbi:esterase FE4-like [Plodia interpunctella]|uniref:esterase FE4-like n=1 Tax=Plodia interpunctella TaxID=58824 RepID=UPI0023682C18|nr:esterase FE4-like [Plodia interpunctella]XP_053622035.1 esterase FE4-like [Plodia interpunctella]
MSCQVKVEQGVLQGKRVTSCNGKTFYSFEGIPYAKPPIGQLRFKNPEDPECWTGIRDATKPGNKACQPNLSTAKIEGSEDCLYLNVYTPCLPAEQVKNLPVLFFVHGGRLLFGYGDWYNPDYFIENDVIFVTINYRLNILGFLCLNIPEAPGNVALKDTIKALKWVNKNIHSFNGNCLNITVIGESAGAAVVTSYMVTKLADGMFNKVIAQSGNILADVIMTVDDPIEGAKHIASLLGKEIDDVKSLHEFFMNCPVDELLNAYFMAEFNRPPYVIRPFLTVVVEKKFHKVERYFSEHPVQSFKCNRYKKVPVLLGSSTHEGALFIRKNGKDIIYENDLNYFVPSYITFADEVESSLFQIKLRQYYFRGREINDEWKLEFANLLSDSFFDRDIVLFPELISKTQNVYVYNFSYIGNLNIRAMKDLGFKGTTHGDIIQYLIYRKNKAVMATDKDMKITKFLSECWCNFALEGSPSWKDQTFVWEPYKPNARLCLDINENKKMIVNPKYNRYKFWVDLCAVRAKI